jgi:hypothetical protein
MGKQQEGEKRESLLCAVASAVTRKAFSVPRCCVLSDGYYFWQPTLAGPCEEMASGQ